MNCRSAQNTWLTQRRGGQRVADGRDYGAAATHRPVTMTGQSTLPRVPAALAILLWIYAPMSSAQVYRWVDSSGQVHYGDVVPDRYKANARFIADRPEPTPEQAREARNRVERDRLEAEKAEPARGPMTMPSVPQQPERPAAAQSLSCEDEWKKFAQSSECYAPYIFARGIKPGAFDKCGPAVAQPRCGPQPAKPAQERTY
jgi:hypothetical protein